MAGQPIVAALARCLFGFAGVLVCTSAQARDANGVYTVEGVGQIRCEAVNALDPQTSPEFGAMAAWLDGYITAHNRLLENTFDITPWQTTQVLLGLVVQFCAANTEATVERAAGELIGYLADDRIQQQEELIAVSNGTQSVLIYGSVRQRLIGALKERDISVSDAPDGFIRALRAFQSQAGLTVSGLPDQRTILALLNRE